VYAAWWLSARIVVLRSVTSHITQVALVIHTLEVFVLILVLAVVVPRVAVVNYNLVVAM
jgi:hypothetical protein